MANDLQDLIGRVAITNQKVGDFPEGHQVVITKILSEWFSPHLEVEQRGKRGSVHLNEIDVLDAKFEV